MAPVNSEQPPNADPAGDESPVVKDKPKHGNSGTAAGDDPPREIGGRDGPDPTRFGDWEKNGRCIDF